MARDCIVEPSPLSQLRVLLPLLPFRLLLLLLPFLFLLLLMGSRLSVRTWPRKLNQSNRLRRVLEMSSFFCERPFSELYFVIISTKIPLGER